jgi:hypothetical protein
VSQYDRRIGYYELFGLQRACDKMFPEDLAVCITENLLYFQELIKFLPGWASYASEFGFWALRWEFQHD